ncbi:MAG TPA: ABC transporter ATP-binding protein [Actinophytocola sp.]|jgi:ABC-type multidrug transport system ATPase subunit|uniref:ABC transporter ATP-binding protein n=1 Tax=Actinophytocola sp. TaxID=1872138 RepID=UPI002F95B900
MGRNTVATTDRAAGLAGHAAALSCQGLSMRLGGRAVLDDVWFDVRPGEVYGVAGPPGSGKSTLLLAAGGLRSADAGTVLAHGRRLDQLSVHARTALVGYLAQDVAVLPGATVLETLRFWARTLPRPSLVDRERIAEVLGLVDLAGHAQAVADRCPAPVRRALGLATALLPDPSVLVLDQFLAGIGGPEADRLLATVRRLRDTGISVLYAAGTTDEARAVCDRLGVLDRGRLRGERAGLTAA